MADQKSFLVYKDSLSVIKKLSIDQKAGLLDAIADYQTTGKLPENNLISIIFEPFLNQFVRDSEKWEIVRESRAIAGSKGGKQKVANASKSKQKVANLAVSVSDSVSDSVIKNQFNEFWDKYNHKKSRPSAEKSFAKSLKSESFEKIMLGVDSYVKSRSPESKFWKHPATWLNQECWNDESLIESNNNLSDIINKLLEDDLIIKIDQNKSSAKLYFKSKNAFEKMKIHPKKDEAKALIMKSLSINNFEFNY